MPLETRTPGLISQLKVDGLMSRPPTLFMSVCQPMHGMSCPKSQFKSTCLTAKFGSLLNHAETGEKGQKGELDVVDEQETIIIFVVKIYIFF